jgi:hypothetical protein
MLLLLRLQTRASPPVNTALPVISQTGSVLSVTTGTWTGDAPIAYAYQFTRNGTPISGATASTYTIPDADLNALFGCIVTATNVHGNASAAAALLYVGVMDVLSVAPAVNYELRRESRSYTGLNKRVRRSSDNAEANFGFATAAQTRTNLAAIPINDNSGSTISGVTRTTIGTGTEFGQPYIDVRWQGTAGGAGALQFIHGAINVPFNPAIHAPATPGLTYTTSVGFRLVSGTAPVGTPTLRAMMITNGGSFTSGTSRAISNPTATLQRNASVDIATANTAYIAPNINFPVGNGEVVDFTVRFYAANVELGVGNARPLLQRNVPETIADIGELDAEALLNFVGNGNGFITILHDKSGNGRNATQTTPANQPRIVSNGAMITAGGKPAILFDGVDDYLAAPVPLIDTTHSLFALFTPTIENVTGSLFGQWSAGQTGRFTILVNQISSGVASAGFLNLFNSSATQGGGSGGLATEVAISNTPTLITSISTTGSEQWKLFKNGAEWDSATITSVFTGVNSAIGSLNGLGSSLPFDGTFSGLTSFPSVLSTDRQTLERNRGAYYGIPIT